MTNTDFTARCIAGKALDEVAGKQDVITDLDTIRAGAAAGATAVQPAALEDYQAKIDSTHKLDADLVDDTNSTNKFTTQSQLDQIGINENNILFVNQKIGVNLVNSASGSGMRWINVEVDLPAGTYTCGFSSLTGDDSGVSQVTFYGANYAIIQPDRSQISKGNNVYVNNITITDTAKMIRVYAASDSTTSQNKGISYTNLFVCKQEAWNASVGVQPYAPSNAELYAMIQALQAQLNQ